jgi:hypothetical protein
VVGLICVMRLDLVAPGMINLITTNAVSYEKYKLSKHILLSILHSRDVAAGALILREAGGFVFDPLVTLFSQCHSRIRQREYLLLIVCSILACRSGGEFDLMARRMAGSNSYLKDQFIKELGDTS